MPTAPVDRPVVLSVAGSDSGGGAGVQADVKTIEASGGFATTAVTAVTAQHTRGVDSIHPVPLDEVVAQVAAVRGDYDVAAVKTGMLGRADVVAAVTDGVGDHEALVVDPVMVATSGDRLLDASAEEAYADLVAAARLVTPNAAEATALTGVDVTDAASARRAARRLRGMGAEAALVTGGHVDGDTVEDVLVTDEGSRTYVHGRVADAATHGSGCTLSAAAATHLARGASPARAVGETSALLDRAIRFHHRAGAAGAVHHRVEAADATRRWETVAAIRAVLSAEGGRVPAGGTVAGATPYATDVDDVAIVEVADPGDPGRARFGRRATLVNRLLAARDADPSIRFAYAGPAPAAVVDGGVRVDAVDPAAVRAAVADAAGRPVIVAGPAGRVTVLAAAAETLDAAVGQPTE